VRPALEHGTSRSGRWLRPRRLRLALWIAVAEGALVLLGVVPRWPAVALAAALVAAHVVVGRRLRWDTLRQASWVAAASQAAFLLVPALVLVTGALAVLALAAVAAVAVLALLSSRR